MLNNIGNGSLSIIQITYRYGKSENETLDKFISENKLKWIPYNQFKNVKYLNKGGFGTVYKAIWSLEDKDIEVALKCLNNLNKNLDEFLNEWNYHGKCLDSVCIINLHGFTKDPETLNYMVVIEYANKGNLRENLTKLIENSWKQRLFMLYNINLGLYGMHDVNLIHCDLHDGNILNHIYKKDEKDEKEREGEEDESDEVFVSDLGLCQSEKFLKEYDIFGVIPFMAREVLRGNPYTPASDIYSFSMIMWEFTSGVPPFNNREHGLELALNICKGERPEIVKNTPQCYVDLMKRCWNEDPLKRPTASEINAIFKKWIFHPHNDEIISEELLSDIMEFINAPTGNNNFITESHPQAYHISRLHNFTSREVNEMINDDFEDLRI
ncbi:hypothetical protein RclHR1_01110024 [Rhizophagus clarus]|uniref:Protein kinase domain-containing protein n=1 Tax=Rhizophagus clarus TaxID=94130 RepID=A0A2Z6QFM1_9GLOM|nr:hypothetical protein RclHR1_01110024 [Rhizophagus clarus]